MFHAVSEPDSWTWPDAACYEPTDNQEIERMEIMSRPHWRVGRAADPQPEDPVFVTENDAIERARKMADAYGFNTPVAVWNVDEPVWVFLMGQQFRRA